MYTGLERVATALDNMERDLKRYNKANDDDLLFGLRLPDGMHLGERSTRDGTYELCLSQIGFDGQMHQSSSKKKFTREDLLALAIRRHVTDFAQGVHEFSAPLERDASEWFQLKFQPKRLQALGVYDPELADLYTRAWFLDGGFVEVLMSLGFRMEFNSKTIHLADATFDTGSRIPGYEIEPRSTAFNLGKAEDVNALKCINRVDKHDTSRCPRGARASTGIPQ